MSMRCLIVDDEPLAHHVILNYINDIPFLESIGQCYRATEALEFLSHHKTDLIFLDIQMPKLNGLDFLRTLNYKPLVIITSAYEQYALESFDLDVCDYLLKPFRFDRFLKAANRALDVFTLKNQAVLPLENHSPAPAEPVHISIKVDKKTVWLPLAELCYLESLGNYVKVWKDGEYLLTPRTLSSFENQLQPTDFIRIHKSFILNKSFVHFLEGNRVHLKNGVQLPVGKNYRQLIKQLMQQ